MSEHSESHASPRPGMATRILEWVCAALLLTMVILLFIQVFGRYALADPPGWTEELARMVFIYATFVGGALAVAHNAHLRIDTLVNALPPAIRPWLRFVTTSIAIIFLGYVLYYSQIMVGMLAHQPLSAVPISKAWVFAAVPVGCALMLIYEIHRLWLEFRQILNTTGPKG